MIYKLKTDKLVIRHNKSSSKSYLYIAPNEDYSNSGLGQLFIIIEAKSREKRINEVLQQVVSELSEYYYHSPTKNAEAALETTAQYFNENINDISNKDLKWIKEKMSIILMAIQDNKLVLSHYNQIKLWLLRDNKIHDVTGGQTNNAVPVGKKILSQLINGQLKNKDILLLTNYTIFDYFSDEKIKKTITTLAPTQACAFFKNTLIDYKINADFSTIVIKFLSYKKPPQQIKDVSQVNLFKEDTDTKSTNELIKLTPKLNHQYLIIVASVIKKVIYNINDFIKIRLNILKNRKANKNTAVKTAQIKKHQAPTTKKETGRKQNLTKTKIWQDRIKLIWQKHILKKMDVIKTRLIIFIALIALLFIGSLLILQNNTKNNDNNNNFQIVSEQIQDKLDSVEQALIYKDNQRARESLSAAKSLLNQLKARNENEQKLYAQLQKNINKQLNKIYDLKEINTPQILANLPNNFKATSNILLGLDDIIYIAQNNQLYKLNSKNKSLDKIATTNQKIIKLANLNKNKIIIEGQTNSFWLMDNQNYKPKNINLIKADKNTKIIDSSIYGNKLYTLDIGINNIDKYIYKKDSFGQPSKWLKNKNFNLSQAISINVDGNIWLVNKNGKINKFFKGREELFNINGNYEKLGDKITLWTQENIGHLYIIDHNKNRIIITDKNGQVKQQLLGDKLDNIISLQTDSQEKQLYLLTNKKIYLIKL